MSLFMCFISQLKESPLSTRVCDALFCLIKAGLAQGNCRCLQQTACFSSTAQQACAKLEVVDLLLKLI